MANEQARADLSALMDGLAEQMRVIHRLRRERAALTASASVHGKRITVMVNADGVVIATRFGPRIADLDYSAIAAGVTAAAQRAAADVALRGQALLAPLHELRDSLPSLDELVPGLPDIREQLAELGTPVVAPTQPVTSRRGDARDSAVADSAW